MHGFFFILLSCVSAVGLPMGKIRPFLIVRVSVPVCVG